MLPLTPSVFPFSNLGTPKIADIGIYFVLTQQAATAIVGDSLAATFAAPGAASAAQIEFIAVKDAPEGGGAETAAGGGAVAALFADSAYPKPSTAPPGAFTLIVPQSSLETAPKLRTEVSGQARLDSSQFDDIVLIISYEIPYSVRATFRGGKTVRSALNSVQHWPRR